MDTDKLNTRSFTSSKEIVARVYRNFQLNYDIPFEDALGWIWEALQLIDGIGLYDKRTQPVEIKNYKGILPCDAYKVIMVYHKGMGLTRLDAKPYYDDKDRIGVEFNSEKTYTFKSGYIKTNFTDDIVDVEFFSLVLDQDGFPEIPNLETIKQALFWYVTKMLLMGGFTPKNKEISYAYADMRAALYIDNATAVLNQPTVADAENAYNSIVRRLPLNKQYKYGFRHAHTRESLRTDGRHSDFYPYRKQ